MTINEQSATKGIGYFVVLAIKLIVGVLVVLALLRIIGVYTSYTFFSNYLYTSFGLDAAHLVPLAMVLTAASFWIIPFVFSYLLIGRKKQGFYLAFAVFLLASVASMFFSDGVNFDRETGKSLRCYVKTLEGFKFSSKCDYDPELGVRFQPVTTEIQKEIDFWEESGKLKSIPHVRRGEYFNRMTGEAIVWYSIHKDGTITLHPLPGFDPGMGIRLKPITLDIIEEYEAAQKAVEGQKSMGMNAPPLPTVPPINGEMAKLLDTILDEDSAKGEKTAAEASLWRQYVLQLENSENVESEVFPGAGYSAAVERVYFDRRYTIISVGFSSQGSQVEVVIPSRFEILDSDSHSHAAAILLLEHDKPLKWKDVLPWYTLGHQYEVRFSLNPIETKRVLFILTDMKKENLRTGYLYIGSQTLQFDLK